MPERIRQLLPNEWWNFLLKTLPFAVAGLAISIGIQVKNKTATVIGVVLSIVIGVSTAWIFGGYINAHFSSTAAPIIIGVVTITGEKVGYWFVYKFNVDVVGEAAIKALIKRIKK